MRSRAFASSGRFRPSPVSSRFRLVRHRFPSRQYSEHYGLRILGYCLMSNHVHLVASPQYADSLAKTLREVHGRYARYRNAIERVTGHLWQNRYYSCAFEGVRLASVMRYVELNPVRAGLVRSASDYAWSSAVTHLGGTDAAELVDLEQWRRDWTPEEWGAVAARGRRADGRREGYSRCDTRGAATRFAGIRRRIGRAMGAEADAPEGGSSAEGASARGGVREL